MNVNFTLGSHFCGGEKVLTKFMLERSSLECGMEWLKTECGKSESEKCTHNHNTSRESFSKPGCCQSVYQTVSVDVETAFEKLPTNQSNINPLPPFVKKVVDFSFIQIADFNYHNFYPPPLRQSLSILFQVFRL